MPVNAKSAWHELLQVSETAVDLEYPVAGPATEVVMVSLTCNFVPLRFTRKFNRRQPTFLGQGFERPVNGGDSQARPILLSSI